MNVLNRERFDAAVVIRDGLRERVTGTAVELGTDATYDGRETVTVVSTDTAPAPGSLPSNRWLFRSTVTLQTFGPDVDAALDAAYALADALLSLDRVGRVRLSNVTCTREPVSVGPSTPSGAATVVSTYTTYLRSEV